MFHLFCFSLGVPIKSKVGLKHDFEVPNAEMHVFDYNDPSHQQLISELKLQEEETYVWKYLENRNTYVSMKNGMTVKRKQNLNSYRQQPVGAKAGHSDTKYVVVSVEDEKKYFTIGALKHYAELVMEERKHSFRNSNGIIQFWIEKKVQKIHGTNGTMKFKSLHIH